MTHYRMPLHLDEEVQLMALRTAFPDFKFSVIIGGGKRRFEAVRIRGGGSLYSVMTTDAKELWQILKDALP